MTGPITLGIGLWSITIPLALPVLIATHVLVFALGIFLGRHITARSWQRGYGRATGWE